MQWLIDVIAERVGEIIGWRRRGDTATADFGIGDFIRDNAWHMLDLSAIVPEGAAAVALEVRLQSLTAGKAIRFRRTGNIEERPKAMESTQRPSTSNFSDLMVSCSRLQQIDYRVSPDPWQFIEITVKGWWLTTSVK